METKFRTLKAGEIDCRIGQVTKTGSVSILLYKNARVDMALLDEVVGPANWQRDHKEIKGNMYCGVGLWDADKAEWIWKWDCGTESNTEREKGESSDSFKRACVNWGIGRELYTAPRIFIKPQENEMYNGKPYLDLAVKSVAYNEQREIISLVIVDGSGKARFTFGGTVSEKRTITMAMLQAGECKSLVDWLKKQKNFDSACKKMHDGYVFEPEVESLIIRAAQL